MLNKFKDADVSVESRYDKPSDESSGEYVKLSHMYLVVMQPIEQSSRDSLTANVSPDTFDDMFGGEISR